MLPDKLDSLLEAYEPNVARLGRNDPEPESGNTSEHGTAFNHETNSDHRTTSDHGTASEHGSNRTSQRKSGGTETQPELEPSIDEQENIDDPFAFQIQIFGDERTSRWAKVDSGSDVSFISDSTVQQLVKTNPQALATNEQEIVGLKTSGIGLVPRKTVKLRFRTGDWPKPTFHVTFLVIPQAYLGNKFDVYFGMDWIRQTEAFTNHKRPCLWSGGFLGLQLASGGCAVCGNSISGTHPSTQAESVVIPSARKMTKDVKWESIFNKLFLPLVLWWLILITHFVDTGLCNYFAAAYLSYWLGFADARNGVWSYIWSWPARSFLSVPVIAKRQLHPRVYRNWKM